MESFSVIVTAHNMESVIQRTLQSVGASIYALRERLGKRQEPKAEIVIVDDGSCDGTWQAINAFAAEKGSCTVIRHPQGNSPSYARNAGVKASTGSLLFFLDGDDLFYPDHIALCLSAMESPGFGFVKTEVHIADPIHPDWIKPINRSVVINLCVRRQCHDAVGGFPDLLLCKRDRGKLIPVTDIFFKLEDMYYNLLITKLFPGLSVNRETVENIRYPGNSFDRQYEKFQLPVGAYPTSQPEAESFRLQLCDAILAHRLHELRSAHPVDECGFLKGII